MPKMNYGREMASDVCVTQIYLNPDPSSRHLSNVIVTTGRAAALCSVDVMSLFCALHIKSFMEAIKRALNGEELAE